MNIRHSIQLFFYTLFRVVKIIRHLLVFALVNKMAPVKSLHVFIPRRYKKHRQLLHSHVRLRILIESLGPTFIKFGQLLSERNDLLPKLLCDELKPLQQSVKAVDFGKMFAMMTTELETDPFHHFSDIDSNCLGSASIGQVYRARLLNGDKVIIKVQRPGVNEIITCDLSILKFLSRLLVKRYTMLRQINLNQMVEEFSMALTAELDYRNEEMNCIRFSEMFRNSPICYIPKSYPKYTTSRLLVQEYIDGIHPEHKNLSSLIDVSPAKIAENGLSVFLRMTLEFGFFHADLHPGNILLLKDGRIALIDFGMTAKIKAKQINGLMALFSSIQANDHELSAVALAELCEARDRVDLEDLKLSMKLIMERYDCLDCPETQLSEITRESLSLLNKYGMGAPKGVFLLVKTLAGVEKLCRQLHPNMNVMQLVNAYKKERLLEKLSLKNLVKDFSNTLIGTIRHLKNAPKDVFSVIDKMKSGKLVHDVNIGNANNFSSIIRFAAKTLSLSVFSVVLMICSVFGIYEGPHRSLFVLLFGVSFFTMLYLVFINNDQLSKT